jgi:uncharacterized protein
MKTISALLINLFIFLIRFYQLAISPFLGSNKCRYIPTCSEYAKQSFLKYGFTKGFWLATKRLIRCAPWGNHGFDPVP